MDGTLRRQLKKLEHDFCYQDTVRLGIYNRNQSDNYRADDAKPDAKKRTIRFELYKDGSDSPSEKQRPNGVLWNFYYKTAFKLQSLKVMLSDWIFLALLGFIVAALSILVEGMVYVLYTLQLKAEAFATYNDPFWQQVCAVALWILYTTGLLAASATFVHYVSPQAIGSGIPEMKTIIRGVVLRDYLTLRTLISKVFGVTLALGSGVPIGKMGPFVHIASAVANQLSKVAARFDPAFASETRRVECLAAACAVGVACTFSAPVGGVLFSIEVTTMYFSVRSYWRGFFAACCGATTIRLMRGLSAQTEVTVTAFYQTSFRPDAFSVHEFPFFVLLGVLCGILGALYISLYRRVVLFLRNNDIAKKVVQRHWLIWPLVVGVVFSIVSFPNGLGRFATGRIKFSMNLRDFFSNCSFTQAPGSPAACGEDILDHWYYGRENVLLLLLVFIIVHIIFSILSLSLPIPSGIFMPVFVLGAAIGRLMGECLSVAMNGSLEPGTIIYPGIYAVVGAASFSASVTHTVSVSVMIFEITGQLHFILPVMISVVISNAVCTYLTPSFFDTIIKIKHLPFLPDIPPSNNHVHTTCAEDIMVSPVMFLTRITTFAKIRELLVHGKTLRIFPVVDSEATQMLIGTISRRYLLQLLQCQVGEAACRLEAERRVQDAIKTIDDHYQQSQFESRFHRTHSDSRLESTTPKPVEGKKRGSRFLVVPSPVSDVPTVFPDVASTSSPGLKRKSSFTRRNAFASMEPNSSESFSDENQVTIQSEMDHKNITISSHNYHTLLKSYIKQAKRYLHVIQFGQSKKDAADKAGYELSPEERHQWEAERLSEEIELTDEDIDPAPFQLVKKTTLFRIHSIFSMLQLSKAYVTDCGRLTGVVALSDVRRELERSQNIREEPKPTKEADMSGSLPRMESELKAKSSARIFDILTPTLEVIRPTTLLQVDESVPVETSDPCPENPSIRVRKASSLRVRRKQSTEFTDGTPHDQVVTAMAYLRRRSVHVNAHPGEPRRRTQSLKQ